jgi:uncharacterized protein (TIGR03066 family)
MKTKFAFVVLAGMLPVLSGCGSSPQDLIIGKWEAGQAPAKLTAEFAKDGKAKITILGQTMQGTYKLNGDDELEWTMSGITTKFKAKVTATQIELSSDGKTVIYTRV